jgi:hypothetical protein
MPSIPLEKKSLLVYLLAMLPIHSETLRTAMPSAGVDRPDVEQPGEPSGNPDVDLKWEDIQPSAVYHHRLPADETLRTVSLTFHPSEMLCVEAVVVAVESSMKLPSAGIALRGAGDGFQKAMDDTGHIMLLWVGI